MVWKLISASSRPLRDFRLVRRVGRVPGRVLENVAQDDLRRVRAVIALADEGAEDLVLVPPMARSSAAPRPRSLGPERQRRPAADGGGDDGVGQRVARRVAERAQHRAPVVGVGADVAGDERVVVLELGQRCGSCGDRSCECGGRGAVAVHRAREGGGGKGSASLAVLTVRRSTRRRRRRRAARRRAPGVGLELVQPGRRHRRRSFPARRTPALLPATTSPATGA